MLNKSANRSDRSSAGGDVAASLELDDGTGETRVPPPETDVMVGCPDPKTCNDPGVTVGDSGGQAAA